MILMLCCNIIHANTNCCSPWCGENNLTDDERMVEINERIIVKKAESIQDFSIRRGSRLAVMEESTSLNNNEKAEDAGIDEDIAANTESHDSVRNVLRACSIVSSICESIAPMSRSHVDSTRKCPICIDDYEIGDEICYSRNKKCRHVFHADCMRNWLMKSNDCPLCRVDYLQLPPGGNKEGRSENITSSVLPDV